MQERVCLQLKIGSCRGCPVEDRVAEAIRVDRQQEPFAIAKQAVNGDCPPGVMLQMPKRKEQSVW